MTAAEPGSAAGRSVRTAPVLVLGGIASVQFGSALAATLFDRIGPAGTVLLRLLFGAVVLLVFARPAVRSLSRADLGVVVIFGLLLGTMNFTFYEALSRLPLGAAVTLEFLGPLVLSVVLARRLLDGLWVLLALGGVLLLEAGSLGGLRPVGVALALVAGACWAGYILASGATGRRVPGIGGLSLACVVGTVLVAPFGLVSAGGRLLHPHVLLVGVLVALLSSVIPYSLELIALRSLPAATFGVLMSLEPAVAALAGRLVLGQTLRPWQIVGIGCVVLASAGATGVGAVSRRRRGRAAPPAVPVDS